MFFQVFFWLSVVLLSGPNAAFGQEENFEEATGSYRKGELQIHAPIEQIRKASPKQSSPELSEANAPVEGDLREPLPQVNNSGAPLQNAAAQFAAKSTVELSFAESAVLGFPVYLGVLQREPTPSEEAKLWIIGPPSAAGGAVGFEELARFSIKVRGLPLANSPVGTWMAVQSRRKGIWAGPLTQAKRGLFLGTQDTNAPLVASAATLQSLKTFLSPQGLIILDVTSESLEFAPLPQNSKELLTSSLEKWRAAWSGGDTQAYAELFSPEFLSEGRGKPEWLQFKQSSTRNWTVLPQLQLTPSLALKIRTSEGARNSKSTYQAWTLFAQDFSSSKRKDRGFKTLAWTEKTADAAPLIVAEVWKPMGKSFQQAKLNPRKSARKPTHANRKFKSRRAR